MTTSTLIKETLKFYSIRDMGEFDGTTGFMWTECDDRSSSVVFTAYDSALDDAVEDYCIIKTENSYFN